MLDTYGYIEHNEEKDTKFMLNIVIGDIHEKSMVVYKSKKHDGNLIAEKVVSLN